MSLNDDINALKARILSEGVLDDETQHHEFVTGLHGRKLDFDLIETGSDFYHQWVTATTRYIREVYPEQPDMLIGVASGSNRLSVSIAAELGGGIIGLMTAKNPEGKIVDLNKSVVDVLQKLAPKFLLIIEDVGTTGSTSSTVAKLCRDAGVARVEVLHTWIRADTLPYLDDITVPYQTLIKETFPNYPPDACEFCKAGSKLISHGA